MEEAFRPMLVELAKGNTAGDPLITFTRERARRQKDPAKARTDALLKRVRQLCEAAGVPEVVSHSLRGVNATLLKLGGASVANVTKALGWTSIEVGKRHYLAPGTIDRMEGRRAHGRCSLAAITLTASRSYRGKSVANRRAQKDENPGN